MTPEQKASRIAKQQQWAKSHPENCRRAHKKWYNSQTSEQRAVTLARKRAYRAANPERFARYEVARKMRVRANPEPRRQAQRDRMGLPTPTRSCPETCECCGKLPTNYSLHLDHDHATGKFRGWLCRHCNLAIGKLGDSLAGVELAIAYLQRAAEIVPAPISPRE